jgi:translation initiation factor IF-2
MLKMGITPSRDQILDQETAQIIAQDMGHKVALRYENHLEQELMRNRATSSPDSPCLKPRPPIVTVMGHVDHGKTSLLDSIRSTKIALGEAGGITQRIGAYQVSTKNGLITFLDTPGHAAFTTMRARGANITDLVVLVVAADDGVMPQTIEAIQHAKSAEVPIIVALNKVDRPEIDTERVRNELAKHGILPEEWGGENMFIEVSAKTGKGIDELLDAILLQSEVLELKAADSGLATGIVIESSLDKGRGPIATVLIREGKINKGDVILCGFESGHVRAMRNHMSLEVLEAGPSMPIEILGLSGTVLSGDQVIVVHDEKKAREVAVYRQSKFREEKFSRNVRSNLEEIFSNIKEGETPELNIILKADTQGSLQAISESLLKLSSKDVSIKMLGTGVGGITESDAMLATASRALIIGFNTRADSASRRIIAEEKLDLRYYSIIYKLIDEVKQVTIGLLAPAYEKSIIGLAQIRNIFKSPKFGTIAGCMVSEGCVKKKSAINILRNNVVIYEGELESLRRFKEDVSEVRHGMECGISIKDYNDIRIDDVVEILETIEIQKNL